MTLRGAGAACETGFAKLGPSDRRVIGGPDG